jgi:hypothetical protein
LVRPPASRPASLLLQQQPVVLRPRREGRWILRILPQILGVLPLLLPLILGMLPLPLPILPLPILPPPIPPPPIPPPPIPPLPILLLPILPPRRLSRCPRLAPR